MVMTGFCTCLSMFAEYKRLGKAAGYLMESHRVLDIFPNDINRAFQNVSDSLNTYFLVVSQPC